MDTLDESSPMALKSSEDRMAAAGHLPDTFRMTAEDFRRKRALPDINRTDFVL